MALAKPGFGIGIGTELEEGGAFDEYHILECDRHAGLPSLSLVRDSLLDMFLRGRPCWISTARSHPRAPSLGELLTSMEGFMGRYAHRGSVVCFFVPPPFFLLLLLLLLPPRRRRRRKTASGIRKWDAAGPSAGGRAPTRRSSNAVIGVGAGLLP
ncbi:hypothetical protein LX32DRAFT_110554 [Colletotrichum zoysiae]|uniref:Uncharacterized protein n=1 Tax=Colletotrichum zoysiae TaxID=1216348 RepID=A0AAD9H8B2_9PEZI|nr:hypothetical protein LX32DRAFT_110554 [Colletotrichum zoysiae]